MKVLLLCDKPPWPGDSGGALATQSIIWDIVTAGNQLDIFYLRTPKHRGNDTDIPAEIWDKTKTIPVEIDTTPSLIKGLINLLFTRKPYNLERFASRKVKRILEQLLIQSDYQIIQFEGLVAGCYLETARSASGARMILRAHNTEHEIWSGLSNESTNPLKRVYYRILAGRIEKIEKKIAGSYDGLITISDGDRLKLSNIDIPMPAITVYPSFRVLHDSFSSFLVKNPIVGFIGSLDWIPNLYGLKWFLSRVWPIVREEIPGSRFIIGGRNAGHSVVRMIRSSGAEYIGYPESSSDFIKSVSLLAVPLFSGSGLRMKIIESLLNGIMVVTTPKGVEGLPDEIIPLIPVTSDPQEMAGFIKEKLLNRDHFTETNKILKERLELVFNGAASRGKLTGFYNMLTHGN